MFRGQSRGIGNVWRWAVFALFRSAVAVVPLVPCALWLGVVLSNLLRSSIDFSFVISVRSRHSQSGCVGHVRRRTRDQSGGVGHIWWRAVLALLRSAVAIVPLVPSALWFFVILINLLGSSMDHSFKLRVASSFGLLLWSILHIVVSDLANIFVITVVVIRRNSIDADTLSLTYQGKSENVGFHCDILLKKSSLLL